MPGNAKDEPSARPLPPVEVRLGRWTPTASEVAGDVGPAGRPAHRQADHCHRRGGVRTDEKCTSGAATACRAAVRSPKLKQVTRTFSSVRRPTAIGCVVDGNLDHVLAAHNVGRAGGRRPGGLVAAWTQCQCAVRGPATDAAGRDGDSASDRAWFDWILVGCRHAPS